MSQDDNETNAMWRQVKEERRQYKEQNRQMFIEMLERLNPEAQIEQLTEYQYRVDNWLDIYPSNKKWHDLTTGHRGKFRSIIDITELLESK